MHSTNPSDYTDEELRDEIERGGRLVVFPYCVSLILVTLRRNSRPYVIPAGQGGFVLSLPWALISLLLGWWGIPWGLIYTPIALWQTLGGGVDLTDEWRNTYDAAVRAEQAERLAALQQSSPLPGSRLIPAEPAPASAPPASFREDDSYNPSDTRPSPFATASKVVLAVGALVLVVYLVLGYRAMSGTRTVTLINGLGETYQVNLNGTPYDCPAGAKDGGPVRHIKIASGRYEVSAALPGNREFRGTVDAGPVSIWNWPGHVNRAVMINADRLALVYREKITYAVRSSTNSKNDGSKPNSVELFVNQGVIDISKPDFYFTDAPASLYIKSNTSPTRTQVGIVPGLAVMQAIGAVSNYCTPAEVATYAARASLFHGSAALYAFITIIDQMPPGEAREILARELDVRPFNVQLHRHYQHYAGVKFRDIDLVADYRALLAADPQNGALAYLLARVLPDHAEARTLYEKAIVAPVEPCAYAYNGLAYEALRDGDHTKALDWFEKAAAGDSESRRNDERLNILVALGRADDALALAKAWFRENLSDLGLAANAMLHLGVCKRPATEAAQTLLAYTNAAGKDTPEDELANRRAFLEATHAYGAGDEKRYAGHLSKLAGGESWGSLALNRALTLGDRASIASQLASAKRSPESWFLAAIDAHVGNDSAGAGDYYAKGIAALRDSDRDSRALAGILEAAGDSTLAIAAIRELMTTPGGARVLFCLLGFRHPSQRDAFWREARAANYARGFPHLFLNRAMSE